MTRQLVRNELDRLRGRYSEILEFMEPRTRLRDGRLGYVMKAQTEMEIIVGADLDSPTAMRETIVFDIDRCEVAVPDPTFTAEGALRFDIEIVAIEGTTVAERLFGEPTEVTMRVGQGVDPFLRPTYGRTEVALGQEIADGVVSTQWVNLEVGTPYGPLRNKGPAEMRSTITQLPPVDSPYIQQGKVDLFNDRGVRMAAKAASMSTIIEIEH